MVRNLSRGPFRHTHRRGWPRRQFTFVIRKITSTAVSVTDGRSGWGFAGDHVRAMTLALGRSDPDDYVVATGETHSVGELCERSFARVGLDWRDHVVVDEALWRPAEPVPLVGDASKARRLLGWSPAVPFAELVDLMVDAEPRRAGAARPAGVGDPVGTIGGGSEESPVGVWSAADDARNAVFGDDR